VAPVERQTGYFVFRAPTPGSLWMSCGGHAAAAYAQAQFAGHDAAVYGPLLHALFGQISFRGAVVREPLILTVASHCCWDQDPNCAG
jgi:hypothetical protein